MRLIDADRLKSKITGITKPHEFVEEIDKRPTVKAIPIEWIRKYTNHRTVEFGDIWVFINCMINDWENSGWQQ